MTYAAVQDRMVDAVRTWWRLPDDDDRFGLSGRISSIWSQFVPERALIDAKTEEPRRPLPSRADIARMQEATAWLQHMPEADRKLVGMALRRLASGRARVPWEDIWKQLGRGKPGPDGLRKRYSAAITAVAAALNG